MGNTPARTMLLWGILLVSLTISTYLLYYHFLLSAGQQETSSFCSAVFDKSCDAALLSRYSLFAGIPLGGWGMIYTTLLGIALLLGAGLSNDVYQDNMRQTAFWMAAGGCSISVFYLISMAVKPSLLCPLCVAFHGLNFGLLGLLKQHTGHTLPELAKGLGKAIRFVVTGKPALQDFAPWKWLGFIVLLLAGLVLYQRIRMELQNQNILKMAQYSPLSTLEDFDTLAVHPVPVHTDDPALGSPDAPVSLIVFSDFQCPACKLFAENFDALVAYNSGKLQIRYKYFPLSNQCNPKAPKDYHPLSCAAARVAEAAHRQQKFWPCHDVITDLDLDHMDLTALLDAVKSVGLDPERFRADFAGESCREKVLQDIQDGLRLGIESTPAVFLNGRRVYDLRPENLNFLIHYLTGPQTGDSPGRDESGSD